MLSRLVLIAAAIMMLQGCETNKRAGDITLAKLPVKEDVVAPNSSLRSDSTQPSDSTQSIAGTNLVTSSPAVNTTTSPSTSSPTVSDTTPVKNSKIPANVISIVRTKPGCHAKDCPVIKVKRLQFAGNDRFNTFLDKTMASMVQMDTNQTQTFNTFNEFSEYFWKTSKPRDEVIIEASVKRGDESIVVVQLDSYIFTGGAHGISTTQYINWLPKTDRLLSLETMLMPNKMKAFQSALRKQYDAWLKENRDAIKDPSAYKKKWPFVESDNAAILNEGIAITYDPYTIAPYYFGRPTLVVPYKDLKGILRPELMPEN